MKDEVDDDLSIVAAICTPYRSAAAVLLLLL
jgi:hypothetical protein